MKNNQCSIFLLVLNMCKLFVLMSVCCSQKIMSIQVQLWWDRFTMSCFSYASDIFCFVIVKTVAQNCESNETKSQSLTSTHRILWVLVSWDAKIEKIICVYCKCCWSSMKDGLSVFTNAIKYVIIFVNNCWKYI